MWLGHQIIHVRRLSGFPWQHLDTAAPWNTRQASVVVAVALQVLRMAMRYNRFLFPLILLVVLSLSVSGFAAGIKYKTSGVFVDSAGGQHAWSINDGHTLIWNSSPYIPAGAVVVADSLAPDASDDAYKADAARLDALKAKGIADVIVRAPGAITAAAPNALQRIISHLDTNGFTYGIEIDDGPSVGLQGYLVSPGRYRIEGPSDQTSFTFDWPGVDSALYAVMNKLDNTIRSTGGAIVRDGRAVVNLSSSLRDGEILMVYPHKTFDASEQGDLWSGYAEYRDRLLAFFRGVKFGSGLRFFVEPFSSKIISADDMAGFLPDSSGFRLGLEAYLTRKYRHEGGLNAGWGLNQNLENIEQAARLVPLWGQGRGAGYFYDRATADLFAVNPALAAQVWSDIADYRDTSVQEYMNSIAEALHKQVANVPVVFKGYGYSRIYANPFSSGFDGVGAQAYGSGEAPISRVAGPLYALAEESGKSTWFIVAGTQASEDGKTGYLGENSMLATLDAYREVGCKGFFIEDLLNSPEQIEWLRSFKGKIGKDWSDFKPQVVYFPIEPPTGAYVKRLARDTWWLPTLRRGSTSYIGDTLFAYTIMGEGKSYIWSGAGKQSVVMNTAGSGNPSVEYPAGVSLNAKKGMFTITLDESPTVIRGIDFRQVFPRDTAQMEISRLTALIPVADKAGLEVKRARGALENANNVLKNGQSYIAYGIAHDALTELQRAMGPDVWIEGEKSPAANFGSVVAAPGASSALALVLDTDEDAPMSPYSATYTFEALTSASYEMWIAGSPLTEASPISYTVDGTGWTQVSAADVKPEPYAPGLAWYKIAVANLNPGPHTLTLRVDGRRTQDDRHYFAIDAIVISPRGFKPNGIVKPF